MIAPVVLRLRTGRGVAITSRIIMTVAITFANSKSDYDPMGNRTSYSDLYPNQLTATSTYNNLNQITQTSTNQSVVTNYFHDGDGNMTGAVSSLYGVTNSRMAYTYDEESRLTSIADLNASNQPNTKTEFVYDGMSRLRISRFYARNGSGALVLQNEKRRVYDGMDIVQERDQNNVVTASITRAGNIGGILARTTNASSVFYGYDGGGNVTNLTNNAGAQVGSYTYDAFGNTVATSGTSASENPYRFSTKEQIGGLYSYGLRFYSPGLGRWINRDPIGEAGGANLYGFVGNNPINSIDAYGRNMMGLSMWNPIHKTGITESDSPIEMPGGASRDPIVYYGRDCQGRAITTNGTGNFYYKDALIKKYGTLNLRSRFTLGGIRWSAALPVGGFPAGTVFRSGKGNPGNFRTRAGESGLSVRDSLSEPYPMGEHGPVFRDKFTAINPGEYGGLEVDNDPPGHATLPGLGEGETEVRGKIGTFDFPE